MATAANGTGSQQRPLNEARIRPTDAPSPRQRGEGRGPLRDTDAQRPGAAIPAWSNVAGLFCRFSPRRQSATTGVEEPGLLILAHVRWGRWNFGVALVAALMLVLQSMAGALALGQDRIQLDAFGNPLCITSGDHSTPADDSDHPQFPNCCTFGCLSFASPLATPPDNVSLVVHDLFETAAARPTSRPAPSTAPDHDPGNPRAPPFA